MTLDRRQFIRLSAAGVVVSLTATACDGGATYELQELTQPELLTILGADAVREIGVQYRQTVPAENDVEALRAAIDAARPWTAWIPGVADPSPGELVTDEFAEGRTLLVQGWVLSRTEARQCALFSLLSS